MDDFINEAFEVEEIEVINDINPDRRQYTINERINHFEIWDDLEFFRRFRLKKGTVERLLQQIEHDLIHPTNRNHCVTPMAQLLLTLRFFASGSLYIVAADFAGVSKATAGKIITKVANAIASLRPQYIALPNNEAERNIVIDNFYRIARFPRTVGAIDCTHIRIQSPGGNFAENYRNRKGYFSLNVQAVCDAQLKFIDIVARWSGASHDSNIFDNSRLRARCENQELGNAVIIGDSG
ncbi:hypothetical protein RN001_006361 [Aquatica leii]|uniref:Putative nuclease HARBI1 n=1 Tax=Aquatica leii TaxID=1421715 RepID=A0AAN7Q3W5_9COLE|nr:hypothetical protein RN001_006361 [Aquatica leii]